MYVQSASVALGVVCGADVVVVKGLVIEAVLVLEVVLVLVVFHFGLRLAAHSVTVVVRVAVVERMTWGPTPKWRVARAQPSQSV